MTDYQKMQMEQIRKALENGKLVYKESDYCKGQFYWDIQDSSDIWTAIANCDDLFIKDGGGVNYNNILQAKKYGLYVHAGERDSFGWLTGICELISDGRRSIMFG